MRKHVARFSRVRPTWRSLVSFAVAAAALGVLLYPSQQAGAKATKSATQAAVAKAAGAKADAANAATVGDPITGTHTVTFDGYSFMVDGQRTYLWSGEFHYFRLPSPDLWTDIFQKMKAAGFNSASLYFDWGYHSGKQGQYDFTGVRDTDRLLDMAAAAGIYVVARPAPYINAEVDGGGFPGWEDTTLGNNRSADANYLKWSDEWQTQIDAVIARHQVTNGTGSVIGYQVENEYYHNDTAGRTYMAHMEAKAKADGITVPLTGNHNGDFNSGVGALDVDGIDSYPQGFNCSNPTTWSGVPNISSDHPATHPLYTPEFQGGAFDPWGGPGYDKCAQLINDQFANVFYKQNIAVGATAQSFYMLYGGTNWGWLGMPENYTSYDYGAAIRETRQLDPKYQEDKLIGYMTHAVTPLTKTDSIVSIAPDNTAIIDTARKNPDTGTQFHTLRHSSSTSTNVDTTHMAIDFNAKAGGASFTWDDPDPTLQYTGTWSHVANQSYTGGDYKNTESFSNVAGDSVSIPFTGTAVQWITSKTNNHGMADVYLDGTKVTTVDDSGSASQAVIYSTSGLTNGPHTLKIVVVGTHSSGSTDNFVTIDAINIPTAGSTGTVTYPKVPQEPSTAITVNGRDSHIIVANYKLGTNQLQYSTSEIMTNATIGGRDIAVLYGDAGSFGETVLNYSAQPTVVSSGGTVKTTWDPASGDLRLNYTHTGLLRIAVSGPGDNPLLLLIGDKPTADTFWQQSTGTSQVIVRGTHLLRGATLGSDGTLNLSGDNADNPGIEVFAGATSVTWDGQAVTTTGAGDPLGGLTGTISTAQPITLPDLTNWKHQEESPEAQPGFDDSSWITADKMSSNSSTSPGSLPVLFADDYGFHTGNTWYRGRFHYGGKETGIHLSSDVSGGAQAFSAWLNGVFIGSSTTGSADFTFPAGAVSKTGDNILSVLTVNMGHEEDYNETNGSKAARGLIGATINGAPLEALTWKLQGVAGGENLRDTVRGPLSTGGLYGERAGWDLPGFSDSSWSTVQLPYVDTTPGVSWYRTNVALNLPTNQDTSLGVTFTDADKTHRYRAELFVNGWMMGNYINYLGPQHSFPVPNGILNPNGNNTIAIAVWNLDGTTGGLGAVSLTNYGSYTTSLQVAQNNSPGYDATKYALPATPGTTVALATPDDITGGQTFTASATVQVPAGADALSNVTGTLNVPAGWTVSASTPASVASVKKGGWARFNWQVTAPSSLTGSAFPLTATINYTQDGAATSNSDERIMKSIPAAPPAGADYLSDLPWVSSTNGWGPVERDTSVGGNVAGDGKTITLAGTTFAKGLGTNSISDVTIYAAGRCSSFTATVGVDDEAGGSAGSVTFSVIADGHTLTTTARQTGSSANLNINVAIPAGAQILDFVVGDGGDGNGNDHGDWAKPILTCGGGTLHSDAQLSDLELNGSTLAGFAPGTTTYDNVGADPNVPPSITATAADNGTVSITPAVSIPGTAIVKVTSEDGTSTATYTVNLVPTSTSVDGGVGGTVPATLSLTIGGPASFGAFVPGVTADYTAQTSANVISTAGDALLSVADPSATATGHLVNGAFSLPSPLQARARDAANTGTAYNNVGSAASPLNLLSWAAPISNDAVSLQFSQHIGSTDALRTGSYGKTLTFTLSTTTP
jgi:beta-galactosidase GanA